MRALLAINPHARRGRELGESVRFELMRRGLELVEDARRLAEIDAIVVAGGDGSFARWIEPALELGVPMGLVPLGTFNDLARTLAIPLDVEGACAVIAGGMTRTIDVARVNLSYYVNEASIGLSSRITRLQKERDKQRLGLLAIALSAFGAVRHMRPFHATIGYDGRFEDVKTVQLTVANSNHFGGFITVDDAAIDDGWLDLYSVEINGFLEAIRVVGAIAAGKRQGERAVRSCRAAAFDVATRRPQRITADGEPAGTTPARFEVLRQALRVFVPERPDPI
jgi:diacylglycerol kinase (ATP)